MVIEEDIAVARWGLEAMIVVGSLLAAASLFWFRGHNLHPLEQIQKFLRRPIGEVLIVLLCVGGLVQHGATKGFLGGSRLMAPREIQEDLASVPGTVDAVAGMFSSYTNAVTNVCATGIMPAETSVFLRAHWPWNLHPAPTGVEVYAAPQLSTNAWVGVGTAPIPGGDNSAVIELPYSVLPDGWSSAMFFMLGLNIDADQDGLSDSFERIISKTDPNLADTDGDGMPDGWEYNNGLNPRSNSTDDEANADADGDGLSNIVEMGYGTDPQKRDSDGDGIDDLDELGSARQLDEFVWYDTSGGVDILASETDLTIDNGVWTIDLYYPAVIGGKVYDRITIDSNALVYLIPSNGIAVTQSKYSHDRLPSRTLAQTNIAVAVNWRDMNLNRQNGSQVRVANITSNSCTVVEFVNLEHRYYPSDKMTAQVVVPGGTNGTVLVNYLSLTGNLDGRSATVGIMDSTSRTYVNTNKFYALQWSYDESSRIASRMTLAYHVGTGTNPVAKDTDGDGLLDRMEIYISKTDPCLSDTDGDGMPDSDEVERRTNPLCVDTDGDGMSDGWEVRYGFNPCVAADADGDVDNDGLSNLEESRHGSNPYSDDTDGDGLLDGVEVELGLSLTNADSDNDGLNDGYEYAVGLDPCHPDTDRDGLPDGWEVEYGLDPDSATGDDGADGDPDHDGLSNIDEYQNGSDPQESDTDGDGASDSVEVGQGSDPADTSDHGVAPPAENFRELVFNINGDYAAWEMTIEGQGPEDTRTRKITMGAPNAVQNVLLKMRKGNSYRLSMRWLNSDGYTNPYSWYCWQAKIDDIPSLQSYRSYSNERLDRNEVLAGNGWVAENADGLLTSHVDTHDPDDNGYGGGNVAEGLVATLYVLDDPRLVSDLDGDGRIDDADDRLLAAGRSFRFWTNDDNDAASPNGDVARGSTDDFPVNGLDWNDGRVNGRRDLVDFTPILADVSPVVQSLPASLQERFAFRLRHADGAFNAVWTDLAPDQANAFQTAVRTSGFGPEFADAPQNAETERVNPSGTSLPVDFAARARMAQGVFLVEGRQASTSPLWLEVVCDGRVVCSNKVETSLSCVEAMYRWLGLRYVCGDADVSGFTTGQPPNLPDVETTGPHYVFVHGYSVDAQSARGWAAEMFKRLWQSGSQSKFTAVDWYGNYSQFVGVSPNYYQNVVHAFRTASALKAACDALPGEKVMLAHSLGNMLVSEAITHCGLQYSKYYMLNAAVPVEAFNAEARAQANMKPLAWQRYSDDLFACNWYDKFSATDGRSVLTWRGIFAGIHDAINCYSPTEDVLGNAPVDGAGGAWSAQELLKGTGVMYLLPRVRREGGWGFNPVHTVPLSQNNELLKTEYTDEEMVTSPPFLPFAEDWLHSTNAVTAAQVAEVRGRILADGIPAQTFAAGANAVGVFGDAGNYNMDSIRNDRWPSNRDGWFHSDLKNVAFWYTYKLFQKIVKGE